jgi:hypothetical protein
MVTDGSDRLVDGVYKVERLTCDTIVPDTSRPGGNARP